MKEGTISRKDLERFIRRGVKQGIRKGKISYEGWEGTYDTCNNFLCGRLEKGSNILLFNSHIGRKTFSTEGRVKNPKGGETVSYVDIQL